MTNKPEVPLYIQSTLCSLPIYMEEMDRITRQIHLRTGKTDTLTDRQTRQIHWWTGRQEHTDGQADKTDTLTDRQTRQTHWQTGRQDRHT